MEWRESEMCAYVYAAIIEPSAIVLFYFFSPSGKLATRLLRWASLTVSLDYTSETLGNGYKLQCRHIQLCTTLWFCIPIWSI
jgi:hypothetical protein